MSIVQLGRAVTAMRQELTTAANALGRDMPDIGDRMMTAVQLNRAGNLLGTQLPLHVPRATLPAAEARALLVQRLDDASARLLQGRPIGDAAVHARAAADMLGEIANGLSSAQRMLQVRV